MVRMNTTLIQDSPVADARCDDVALVVGHVNAVKLRGNPMDRKQVARERSDWHADNDGDQGIGRRTAHGA